MSDGGPTKLFFFVFIFLVLSTSFFITIALSIYERNLQYYNGLKIDMPLGAPNGTYRVWTVFWDNTSVFFPCAIDSGSHLHGAWQYDNSSGKVIFQDFIYGLVKLRNNIIVEAKLTK